MGFSVSGSTVVILIGCLIAFSAAYTVATDSIDSVTTAQDERADSLLEQQNTAIEIDGVDGDTVTVTNTGSTTLSIERTDLIVDGDYVADANPTFADGSANADETDLWLPGETLVFETGTTDPDHVKIVTEHGVEATRGFGGSG